jgi:hypothetical protein
MGNWKRLTGPSGTPVEVNLDAVAYMLRPENASNTILYFNAKDLSTAVQETPDEIARRDKLM